MSTIVYIGAVGRSGTTLLERTLATCERAAALGELVHLWDRGVGLNEPCGCGLPFHSCPFWLEVGRRAFGGWDLVDLDELRRDRRRVDRNRYIPWLIAPRLAPRPFQQARNRLIGTLDQLYIAIGEVATDTGNVVLVDSSKHPSYLFLLRALPSHQLRLLHVVRDPRGVAHSWTKRVSRPESSEDMERLGTVSAVGRWTSHNLLFQLASWLRVPTQRLAYEQFTADPTELFRRAEALLSGGDSLGSVPDLAGNLVELGIDHTASGNPMRFRSGNLTIRSDQAWRSSLPSGSRRVIELLTTPLRQWYAR
ncbi:MAG: sulfotransferase [Ilumatobacteraceae bacterium]|nr:sulfotransferase [Ilumatobacteraceae bacterium]